MAGRIDRGGDSPHRRCGDVELRLQTSELRRSSAAWCLTEAAPRNVGEPVDVRVTGRLLEGEIIWVCLKM